MYTVHDCKLIDLPRIQDPRGNLSFAESGRQVPFDIRRVFYLYDVPGGESRAGHALKSCHQFVIAMSGSFDVIVKDGYSERRVQLNRSYYGLHLPPLVWRELDNFSSGSVCVVLASELYDEQGYYRDYPSFLAASVSSSGGRN
ncbi:MAG: FdtA/QdtA family cupin domain-containing protein [Chloroflexia bacterium]